MKLQELMGEPPQPEQDVDTPEQEDQTGTYAGVRFSEKTKSDIEQYQQQNQIPNPVGRDTLHSTLLYSRKPCPNYQPYGSYDQPMIGEPQGLELWPMQTVDEQSKKYCLVLRFNCDQLCERHKELMDQHQASYDFDQYIPHVTLAYGVNEQVDPNHLPAFEEPLEIVEEYYEPLDDNAFSSNEDDTTGDR